MFFLLLIPISNVYAEHVFDMDAFGQFPDIVQLSSEKFVLEIDGNSYDLYYGYHGSMDSMTIDEEKPTLSSMSLNPERLSLEITFDEVPINGVFWVRMPFEVISAEKEQFQLFIDGVETQFDLTKFPNDYALGMIIPKNGQHIEIVGTKVIPEFGTISILILGITVLSIVFLVRKSPFGPSWTRIN